MYTLSPFGGVEGWTKDKGQPNNNKQGDPPLIGGWGGGDPQNEILIQRS